MGRFTSVDPARDGLNWYAYCNCDPVNFIDPNGKSAERGKNTMDVVEPDYYVVDGVKWYTSADDVAYVFGVEHNKYSVDKSVELAAGIVSKKMYEFNGTWYPLMGIVGLSVSGEIPSIQEFFRNAKTMKVYTYADITNGQKRNMNVYEKYRTGTERTINGSFELSRHYGKVVGIIHTHGSFDLKLVSEKHDYDGNDVFSTTDINTMNDNNVFGYLVTPLGKLRKYTPYERNGEYGVVIDESLYVDPEYVKYLNTR